MIEKSEDALEVEREKRSSTFDTPLGQVSLTETIRIRRETYSGKRQVFETRLEAVEVVADGNWLDDEMAGELVAHLYEGAAAPKWLVQQESHDAD